MKFWAISFFAISMLCLTGCPGPIEEPGGKTEIEGEQGPTTEGSDNEGGEKPTVTAPSEADVVAAVACIERLAGTIVKDGQGRIVDVDLDDCGTTDADMELITKLTDLKKAFFFGANISNVGVEKINRLTKLGDLTVHNTAMDSDGFGSLTALSELAKLNIERNSNLRDEAFGHLRNFPKLKYLMLLQNDFTDKGMADLSDLKLLALLDLRGLSVSGKGLAHIAGLENLRALKLRSTNIDDDSLVHLRGLTKLTSLIIEDSPMDGSGCVAIKDLPLEDLNLARNVNFTNEAVQHFAGFSNLKKLNLRQTLLGGAGLTPIKSKVLVSLDLSQSSADDETLEHIGTLKSLEILHLWQAIIGTEGLQHLNGLSKLKELDVEDCWLDDSAATHLAKLTSLEKLNIMKNGFTDASIEHLKKLTKLKSLDISMTQISEDGIADLQKALPDCEIITVSPERS